MKHTTLLLKKLEIIYELKYMIENENELEFENWLEK
jgi:hypothetical protein